MAAQLIQQHRHRLGLVGRLGDAEPAGQRGQLASDGGGLVGGDPPDQVVVAGVPVAVLQGQLGLADPAQPVDGRGLHHRCSTCRVQVVV